VPYINVWYTLNLDLCRVKDIVLVFYMQISRFLSKICCRSCLLSIICFGHLGQKLSGCNYINLYLSLLFCSISLHVCICASTILFLLLLVCSTWSHIFWYIQHCNFCSEFPWLFVVFFTSKWMLGLLLQFHWGMSLEFVCGLHWV
jgi:hypothetical protein